MTLAGLFELDVQLSLLEEPLDGRHCELLCLDCVEICNDLLLLLVKC